MISEAHFWFQRSTAVLKALEKLFHDFYFSNDTTKAKEIKNISFLV